MTKLAVHFIYRIVCVQITVTTIMYLISSGITLAVINEMVGLLGISHVLMEI